MRTKDIRIKVETWKRLIEIREKLTLERGKNASLDDVINYLLERYCEK